MIDHTRLAEVANWWLKAGAHPSNKDGNACVMEAVAYVAGRKWSDSPPCVSPIITAFMRSWNDALPTDADRDRLLKPLIPKLIGTQSTAKVEKCRSYLALDWLIRVHTPQWLDLVPALKPHAKALRDLEVIANTAGAVAAGTKVNAARAAAGDAGAAARAAARAAGAAARAAVWDAGAAAAGTAAGAFLKPTTEWLQKSALNLVDRMIEVQPMNAECTP